MRTTNGLTPQEAHELKSFLRGLEKRRITTPELKSVLMILRQYSKSEILIEWADSVAHNKRNKGKTFKAGQDLWLERFQLYAYFSTRPDLKRIPIPIFEMLITVVEDPAFDLGADFGVDMKRLYPDGYSRAQISHSLKYMYFKSESNRSYELISEEDINFEDIVLIREIIPHIDGIDWSNPPFKFTDIKDEIAAEFQRLIRSGKAIINKHADLLALHFLCAFHLTEIKLEHLQDRNMRCFLCVHSTSDYLSLNLGLYQREGETWDAIEIASGSLSPFTRKPNIDYSRPFLITNLEEAKHVEAEALNEKFYGTLFRNALDVKSGHIGPYLCRVIESSPHDDV